MPMRKSFKDSLKTLEADIQYANTLYCLLLHNFYFCFSLPSFFFFYHFFLPTGYEGGGGGGGGGGFVELCCFWYVVDVYF